MTTYTIKSGYVSITVDTTDLDAAMAEADAWLSYNQHDVGIYEDDNLLASRHWYGCLDGIEDEENPIQFGDFGYYADWVIND